MKLFIILCFALFFCAPAFSEENRFSFVDAKNFPEIDCTKIKSQLQEVICRSDLAAKNAELEKWNGLMADQIKKQKPESLPLFDTEKKEWKEFRNASCNLEASPRVHWDADFANCVADQNEKRIMYLKVRAALWSGKKDL